LLRGARLLSVRTPLEDRVGRLPPVPALLQGGDVPFQFDRPLSEGKVLIPRLSLPAVIVMDVREAESVPQDREVLPRAVGPLVEVGVPDVQAVPQVWDGVEDLSQDFWWLVDVLDRHDDIPVRRRIDEVGEPGGLRLRRDPRGRTCLEEMGVEDLRPYRREGVDEADESREVRLME